MIGVKPGSISMGAVAIAATAMLLVGCGGNGDKSPNPPPPGPGPGGARWTVLVYSDGDGDLEDALIGDFNEMEIIGSTPEVNVVVQMDRHPGYDASNDNWTTCRRYLVTQDPAEPGVPNNGNHNDTIVSTLIEDIGEVNMGDEQTLVDFVEWGMQNFPAARYFLILSNHGSGWRPRAQEYGRALDLTTRGIIFDETSNFDSLSNAELKSALQRIEQTRGRNLEILGMDASEMALLEVAYQVRDHVDYLIASQLSEPNDGYAYDEFLFDLTQNPTQPVEAFLAEFVADYVASYASGQGTVGAGGSVTQTVFREANLATLVAGVDDLAHALQARLPDDAQDLIAIRGQTQSFSEPIYRDAFDFADRVQAFFDDPSVDAAAQAVKDAIAPGAGRAIVAEAHKTGFDINVDDAHGVMLYLPGSPLSVDPLYSIVLDFGADTHWDEYIGDTSGLP